MLQGDNKDDWNAEPFRMFKGGSLWLPPKKNLYTAGMPEDIFEESLRYLTMQSLTFQKRYLNIFTFLLGITKWATQRPKNQANPPQNQVVKKRKRKTIH